MSFTVKWKVPFFKGGILDVKSECEIREMERSFAEQADAYQQAAIFQAAAEVLMFKDYEINVVDNSKLPEEGPKNG